jgi:hypothetical protein
MCRSHIQVLCTIRMKIKKTISLVLLSSLIACNVQRKKSNENDESHLSDTKKREYAYFSDNGKLLRQFRLDSNGIVYGRSDQMSIMLFEYKDTDQLIKVTFLDKDSILCSSEAYILYQYNKSDNIISEQSYDDENQRAKYKYPITYNYNEDGILTSKIREGKTNRSPFSNPGMIKYQYDDEKRITREEYFNSEGKTASVYEMGIQAISYEYNEKDQLIKEIHFYSGTIDPEAKPQYRWEHTYTYGSNAEVLKCDVTWDFFGKMNKYSTFFKYDIKKNLYGVGRDSSLIEVIHPYEKIKNVVYQEIYSNDYYLYFKRPKF